MNTYRVGSSLYMPFYDEGVIPPPLLHHRHAPSEFRVTLDPYTLLPFSQQKEYDFLLDKANLTII